MKTQDEEEVILPSESPLSLNAGKGPSCCRYALFGLLCFLLGGICTRVFLIKETQVVLELSQPEDEQSNNVTVASFVDEYERAEEEEDHGTELISPNATSSDMVQDVNSTLLVDELVQDLEQEQRESNATSSDDGISPNHRIMSLPRSAPDLVYNEIDTVHHSYVIYAPAGGMSNQQMMLENAMGAARLLKRTLYVPMIGKHESFVNRFRGYNSLKQDDLYPADRILDFRQLAKYNVRVIPLNCTLHSFLLHYARTQGKDAIQMLEPKPTKAVNVVRAHIHDQRHSLLFLNGINMYHHWFRSSDM